MPKITELFCFAIDDKDENDEGVPAFNTVLGPMPLMGADVARVESLMTHGQTLADLHGKPVRIYKFSHKEQIGEIQPRPNRPDPWPQSLSKTEYPEMLPDRCVECNAVLMGSLTNHSDTCGIGNLIRGLYGGVKGV